jgi:hypothetical protein
MITSGFIHMSHKTRCFVFIIFLSLKSVSQTGSMATLSFDFNDQQIKEVNNKLIIKPVGVTLTEDRFGNKESAVYIHGTATSYINLGTSTLLKPKTGSISLWVKVQAIVRAGKGYTGNPFLMTRSCAGEDFNIAYGFGYNADAKRIGVQASRDSVQEVMVFAKDTAQIGAWYHLVMTSDNNYFKFYLNGELEGGMIKGFESKFLEGDSVILGRSMGYKNERFAHAIFDDIRFYNRVLSEQEVKDLYNEPNPNRFKNFLNEVLKYGIIIIILTGIIILILIRNRRNLKKQKEYYELNHKIKELEIKVIKTQMNPHFISNCLAAIQNLIYTGQIDKAGEYLAKFSFFLRQILDLSDKTYISLEEEIALIKLNVELEQLRFKNNFSFHLDIEEGIHLNEILIPSLISQPFIENAIWHGLLPLKGKDPKLTISIYMKNSLVYIAIEDNGVGRADAKTLAGKKSRGTRLAADKIDSINRLMNSSEYNLEIIDLFDENKLPAGTKIIIQLSRYTLDE